MGLDYALMHVKFTLPLTLILTILSKPFLTRLDAARISFLIIVAVTATTPWDSHLIRTGVWTYAENGVLGNFLFSIPVEEVFFFVIQSYITSVIYILCNKPVLQPQYLGQLRDDRIGRIKKIAGQVLLSVMTGFGCHLIILGGQWTYFGLIVAWACPFLLITWTLAAEMILSLPWTSTILPIMVPTAYLWYVDELYLRNGTWAIETSTKLDKKLFGALEVEEALFFLITNTLIVFGLVAFDTTVAVCDSFPQYFPQPADSFPLRLLLPATVFSTSKYDMKRIKGLCDATTRLEKKSRSFTLASSFFSGRIRIDLTLLYSYCRLADDLVDNANTAEEALSWIAKLQRHLDLLNDTQTKDEEVDEFIHSNFPSSAWTALELLPSYIVSLEPLYGLLDGFRIDTKFRTSDDDDYSPISDESELELYASKVASTVGELCLDVAFHHIPFENSTDREIIYTAAREMGVALQYVNIARDISVDAAIGRVYLPTTWLVEQGLSPRAVIEEPFGPKVDGMRTRLLEKAFDKYRCSRGSMRLLPDEVRGAMIVAIENYMEIGRVLVEGGGIKVRGKATVPILRRFGVVWKALWSG